MRAWINGRMLEDPTTPVLPVNDHGFTVGDAVFESIKSVHGQPFALTRHLDRLTRSARGLGLPDPDHESVRAGVAAVLHDQQWALGRIRITYSAGPAPMGSGRGDGEPTLVVTAAEVAPMSPTAAIVTVPWPRNERGATAGLKTTSYAENVMALAYAAERDAQEAVFATTRGDLCEATGSNVFYVVGGELRTPTLQTGCLAGVTRQLLLEWHGAREIHEPIEVMLGADEIFLTSTTRNVQAVHRVNERELVAPGPITRAAMAAWEDGEAREIDP